MKRLAVCLILLAPSCAAMPRSADCYSAIDRHWPAASRAWARSIVWRESRNTPTAQNPRSSAAGCFQMIRAHWWRIPGGASQRYNADANTLGALSLYREVGRSPWSL